mmetsp:Transcript_2572/g.5790  ORF Transcript_2572/g.5790 Transcript_2572/m.5790 type:complete len:130 (+) Transcript_2572:97-486(+)
MVPVYARWVSQPAFRTLEYTHDQHGPSNYNLPYDPAQGYQEHGDQYVSQNDGIIQSDTTPRRADVEYDGVTLGGNNPNANQPNRNAMTPGRVALADHIAIDGNDNAEDGGNPPRDVSLSPLDQGKSALG